MTGPRPRPGILDIAPYVPGPGGGGEVIKLSSNESALGPSPRAIEAARAAAGTAVRYPDGSAAALRRALGRRWGLDPARLLCGSGSDELLEMLARAYAGPGDEVLHGQYGFAIYPIAARAAGATPVAAPEPEFRADVDSLLASATERTAVVFLANPNNPTGSYIPAREVRRLRRGLPERTLLVLDSAYAEFVERDDYSDGAELVHDGDDTVMTRTFSKIYSLAGFRVGWLYGPAAAVDALHRIRPPFNVNTVAQAAAEAAIADEDRVAAARRHNARWLPRLTQRLRGMGLTVHDSVVNFVLVRFPGGAPQAGAAERFLARRRILVRKLDGYGIPDGLRINIGLDHEMEALGDALQLFLEA